MTPSRSTSRIESNPLRPDSPPATCNPWDVAEKNIYFIGIGGCGMSGLAKMLKSRGANALGSDRAPSSFTEDLEKNANISVQFDTQDSGDLPEDCDLVIHSAAIAPGNPQLATAVQRGVPVLSYAEALGQLMLGRTGVSIAGTHGKSTTTAMLAHILIQCGKDPSFVVGANCSQIGGGSRTGSRTIPDDPNSSPGILLAEACEFNRSFHHHKPTLGCILNVEEDHLDIYQSIGAIINAFHDFAQMIPAQKHGGYLLIHHDQAHRTQAAAGLDCKVETFGLSTQADWAIQFDPESNTVRIIHENNEVAHWHSPIPGEHMAMNAAAAAVLAHQLGVSDWNRIAEVLELFAGVDRRMQKLGKRAVPGGHVTVYDDYGHHPTEIDATLRALRAYEKPTGRLICVFQPHQHSRTRFLLDEFATSFESADIVIVPHIYFVRDSEAEKSKVSARDLVDRLRRTSSTRAMHLYPFEAIVEQLENICQPNDLLVVMGAGPVWQVAHQFLRTTTTA